MKIFAIVAFLVIPILLPGAAGAAVKSPGASISLPRKDLKDRTSDQPFKDCAQKKTVALCDKAIYYYADRIQKKKYKTYSEFCHNILFMSFAGFQDGILTSDFTLLGQAHKATKTVTTNCFDPWQHHGVLLLQREDQILKDYAKGK